MEQYKNCMPVIFVAVFVVVVGGYYSYSRCSPALCTSCTAELIDAAKAGNPAAQAALMEISAGSYDQGGSLAGVIGVVMMISVIALIAWLWGQSQKKLPFLQLGENALRNFADRNIRGRQ